MADSNTSVVVLADCKGQLKGTEWFMRPVTANSTGGAAAAGRRQAKRSVVAPAPLEDAAVQVVSSAHPDLCLGTAAVDGTSEFMMASLVDCKSARPCVHWVVGSRYLNLVRAQVRIGCS